MRKFWLGAIGTGMLAFVLATPAPAAAATSRGGLPPFGFQFGSTTYVMQFDGDTNHAWGDRQTLILDVRAGACRRCTTS